MTATTITAGPTLLRGAPIAAEMREHITADVAEFCATHAVYGTEAAR
jgi:hypothetical protein